MMCCMRRREDKLDERSSRCGDAGPSEAALRLQTRGSGHTESRAAGPSTWVREMTADPRSLNSGCEVARWPGWYGVRRRVPQGAR